MHRKNSISISRIYRSNIHKYKYLSDNMWQIINWIYSKQFLKIQSTLSQTYWTTNSIFHRTFKEDKTKILSRSIFFLYFTSLIADIHIPHDINIPRTNNYHETGAMLIEGNISGYFYNFKLLLIEWLCDYSFHREFHSCNHKYL